MMYIRSSIIILIQTILPIIALLVLTPWFINANLLTSWKTTFANIQPLFLILHGLLYLALILFWPKLVVRTQNQLTPEQLNTTIKARWYLLAIFVFIDALIIWRKF